MKDSEVKSFVETILKFECPRSDADNAPDFPYVIVAPARGGNHLRIYAYGGCAGGIGIKDRTKCVRADKEYSTYLEKNHIDGQGHHYTVPKWLAKELSGKNPVSLWENRGTLPIDSNEYLSLAAAALQNRSAYHGERREQTRIARKFMNVLPGDSMLVTDIEYVAPKLFTGKVKKGVYDKHELWKREDSKGRKSLLKIAKPDFILFDGKSFGLVEFKYDGKSMDDGSENSLKEHMLDFSYILAAKDDPARELPDWIQITDEKDKRHALKEEGREPMGEDEKIRLAQWELFDDCCNNMRTLLTYELVPQEWEEKLKKLEDKYTKENREAFAPELLWCGFLFVGGAKDTIKSEIITQLKCFENSQIDIRYQICEKFPDALTMRDSVKNLLIGAAE